jgi:asparagine synthase (glutamine-hydrolysing)
LPADFFFYGGWTKSILRNAMVSKLPIEITWRKDKIGFEAPHESWSKSPNIKDILEIAKADLIQKGYINSDYENDWKILILSKMLQKNL